MEKYEAGWKNYYEVLGITPTASDQNIKAAYRKLARKYHPDIVGGSGQSNVMAIINEAYETLIDPDKRAAYDRKLEAESEIHVSGTGGYTNERRKLTLFWRAFDKASAGKTRQQVIDELNEERVPHDMAAQVTEEAFEYRLRIRRSEGRKAIGWGGCCYCLQVFS